jgi:hypothetical protein
MSTDVRTPRVDSTVARVLAMPVCEVQMLAAYWLVVRSLHMLQRGTLDTLRGPPCLLRLADLYARMRLTDTQIERE